MQFPLLSIAIIAGIMLTGVFIAYILKYRPARNYKVLLVLTCGCMVYLVSQLFEYISTDLKVKIFWNHGTSIGITVIILSFFIFSVGYAGKEKWLNAKKVALISILPALWLVIDLTNELHGLSLEYGLETFDGCIYLTKDYNSATWVFIIYGYALFIISYGFLISLALSALNYYKKRVVFILLLATIPMVANVLHMFGFLILEYFDPTPISVTFSILLFLFGVTRYNIGEIVPTTNKALIDSIRDGVIVLDNCDCIVDINPIARKILGYPKIIGEDIKMFWPQYLDYIADGHMSRKELEVGTGGEKDVYDVDISECLDHNGNYISRIISLRNITERKKTEEKLKYLSFHDKMTGLYNRVFFEEEMARLDNSRQLPISLIMGDADGLKFVNDTFGYAKGDELLASIAEIMVNSCRKEDIIARWGGDEFVIMLTSTAEEKALKVVSRIEKACAGETGKNIPISISLGAATKKDKWQNLNGVLKVAEDRMRRRKMLKTESVHSAMIKSLKNTLHEKSHETREHLERLEDLSRKFGKRLGLTSSQLDDLSLIAVLHDIGKITIADRILSKKGKLTGKEWDEMKRHSEIGFRITSASPQIAPIAESILHHHEWWDGSGYPAGLRGNNIPLLSRIISIIDAYDVMRNGRPYKKPMNKADAIEELIRCSGTQFDPRLVKDFIMVVKEKEGLEVSNSPSS